MDQVVSASGYEIPAQSGEDYKRVLARLHSHLRPKNYLEIGSRTGDSLALATCPSIAIDPEFRLKENFINTKRFCGLYKMGSDEFFSSYNPRDIFGTEIDFAFLDGMHLAEFLLRDFANVERHCRKNSIIALHDCIPTDQAMARRHERVPDSEKSARHPGWWTGDVWKFLKILIKHRTDLRIICLDAAATGLVLVTKLDPTSTLLTDEYYSFVDEIRSTPDEGLSGYVKSLQIISTSTMTSYEDISKHFWL